MEAAKTFMSVRETARHTGLAETYIRKKLKNGLIPHIMSGNKVLINVPLYLKILNDECEGSSHK